MSQAMHKLALFNLLKSLEVQEHICEYAGKVIQTHRDATFHSNKRVIEK